MLTVIDLTDALEKLFVEHDLVLEVGEFGLHLLLYFANLGCLVGIDEGKERATDALEQASALLKGQNGVLERGRVLAVNNLLDVVTLLLHGRLEGRHVVGILNLAEVGGTEGHRAISQ